MFFVLSNLKTEFEDNQINTTCGIALVAINPYREILDYSNQTIQANDNRVC